MPRYLIPSGTGQKMTCPTSRAELVSLRTFQLGCSNILITYFMLVIFGALLTKNLFFAQKPLNDLFLKLVLVIAMDTLAFHIIINVQYPNFRIINDGKNFALFKDYQTLKIRYILVVIKFMMLGEIPTVHFITEIINRHLQFYM